MSAHVTIDGARPISELGPLSDTAWTLKALNEIWILVDHTYLRVVPPGLPARQNALIAASKPSVTLYITGHRTSLYVVDVPTEGVRL